LLSAIVRFARRWTGPVAHQGAGRHGDDEVAAAPTMEGIGPPAPPASDSQVLEWVNDGVDGEAIRVTATALRMISPTVQHVAAVRTASGYVRCSRRSCNSTGRRQQPLSNNDTINQNMRIQSKK